MNEEQRVMEVCNFPHQNVAKISRTAFLSLTPNSLMQANCPFIVDFLESIKPGNMIELIRSSIGDLPVALFEKSSDSDSLERSQAKIIPLNKFFDTPEYSDPSNKSVYRIVTNIKNETALIDQIIDMKADLLFPYQKMGNSANIWINYEGKPGRAHFDELENFNLQLEGSKRFICLPPGRNNFYISSFWRGFGNTSQVSNLDKFDETRFPKLVNELSNWQECILQPGQLLYIPLGWWHQVEPLGKININLNFWLQSCKLLRHPYIFADGAYKAILRRALGLYDYQPSKQKSQKLL